MLIIIYHLATYFNISLSAFHTDPYYNKYGTGTEESSVCISGVYMKNTITAGKGDHCSPPCHSFANCIVFLS